METAPDSPPPSNPREDIPSFTLHELEFVGIDYIGNVMYIIFNTGYELVKIKEFEYYAFFSYCLRELEACVAGGEECSCVLCTPSFEEDPTSLASAVNIQTKESIPLKTYICTNLIEGCKTSVHENH